MKAVYISGPYTAPTSLARQRNINAAWELAVKVWGIRGAYAVCPHANTAHMDGAMSSDHELDYRKFIDADLDLVSRCDAVLMMRGWENSRGSTMERAHAYSLGIPVFYEEWDGLVRLQAWVACLGPKAVPDDVIATIPPS